MLRSFIQTRYWLDEVFLYMWNKWYKVQIVSMENKNYPTIRLMENIPLAVVKN